MNLAFVGYKELCRSRRVLPAEVDNTLRDLHASSYHPQPHSLITNYACGFNQSETGKLCK